MFKVVTCVCLTVLFWPCLAAGSDLSLQITEAINAQRKVVGIGPVKLNPALSEASEAMVKMALAAGKLDGDPCDALTLRGYRWKACQFSMGGASAEPNEALKALGQSVNILERAFTEIGIGIVLARGQAVFGVYTASPIQDAEFNSSVFLEELSKFRQSEGRSAVRLSPVLNQAAEMWAKAHATHQIVAAHRFGQSNLESRLMAVGWQGHGAYENVGRFIAPDPAEVLRQWAASPGHRKNMEEEKVREIGVACAHAPLRNVQDMGEYVCVLVLADSE